MKTNWEEVLKDRLKLYGHRNWIVVADSAYPSQSSGGIETIVSGKEQTTVLNRVCAILGAANHVQPTIYTDKELEFVVEKDAPGVSSYRKKLGALLAGYDTSTLPHEEIIAKLDRAGEMFQVLLIKTNMRIPYTTVFFELQCGYWNSQAEKRLRAAMRPKGRKPVAPKRKAMR